MRRLLSRTRSDSKDNSLLSQNPENQQNINMITVQLDLQDSNNYFPDAQTVIGFLKTYNLDKDFKLNIEPNHTTLVHFD